MMKSSLSFVWGISLFFSVASCQEEDACLCVEPTSRSYGVDNPCQDKCRPLMYYAENVTSFKNYSTFYFLPGTHLMTNAELKIGKVNHLVLRGYGNSTGDGGACGFNRSSLVATVECEGNEAGFYFKDIDNLAIVGIRFNNCGYGKNYTNTITLFIVWNLCIHTVEIHNARGVGIYGYEVVGKSNISNTLVNSSKRFLNSSSGNMHFYYEYKSHWKFCTHYLNISDANLIDGENNHYLHMHRPHAGGIYIYMNTTNAIHITLKNITMSGNSGYNGGNAAIEYIALGNCWLSTITIQNCSFFHGIARGFGGGLYTALITDYSNKTRNSHCPLSSPTLVLHVNNSFFEHNHAQKVGAGTYLQLYENKNFNGTAFVSFTNCHFKNNNISSSTEGRGGSAVNIINFRIPNYTPHPVPQYNISFASCSFNENDASVIADASVGSSAFYVEENAVTILRDCEFLNNKCTGLSAVQSNLLLEGLIEISNNTAISGGGIVMCANSVMYLDKNVTVILKNNHATQDGGGIYTEFECAQAIPPCFFQVESTKVALNRTVYLEYNTANRAGSALYGGSIDNCYFFGPYNKNVHKDHIFDHLFTITSLVPDDMSNITSNPIRVCFCEVSTSKLNCDKDSVVHNTFYSGGTVSVYIVVVGQRHGTVPGVVMAKLDKRSGIHHTLGTLQGSQVINSTNCTKLDYTLYTNSSASENVTYESISLSVQNSNFRHYSKNESRTVKIKVHVLPCPPGFSLKMSDRNQPVCKCLKVLNRLSEHMDCNITTTSIHRSKYSKWWIGFPEQSLEGGPHEVQYQKHCPFDYCVSHSVDINTTMPNSQNVQCANNRIGSLCGHCQHNMSNILASRKCVDCRNTSFVVVPGTIVLLFLAGIILVLLIANMDLSVSEGRLNGMVFYMNVVSINSSYLDHDSENRIALFLKGFVAWMNLDLGIETCFYNGMGAVAKTALEFVFPLYLWCLSGLIIYCGRRSSMIMKLFGKNTVKVLATLILLSYAKLLRTVIDICNLSIIKSNNGNHKVVWTIDGNISYFYDTAHKVLFALAVVVTAVTLPYTLSLLFIQCLRKRSNMKILFWVNKLKPFFDTYTGPYKDRYHFWTGFLLVVRIVIFLGIVGDESPILNLTVTISIISLLLLLIQPGIYKTSALNIVEAFTYFNLIIFTALTTYNIRVGNNNNDIPLKICVGSMFLLFCGIVFYHVYKRLSDTQKFRIMKMWLLNKRWPWMKRKPIRSVILPYIDPDNIDELSSSDNELDPLLINAPPLARYDEYREPLIETGEDT